MSVDFIDQQLEGDISTDRTGALWITDKYLARTTDPDDSLSILQRDIPQLQRWQRHPIETLLFVDKFKATRRSNTNYWDIQVDYTNSINNDPINAPAKYSVRSQRLDSYTIVDRNGRPLTNTAGDLVLPQKKPEVVLVFSIKKNLNPNFPNWLLNYPEKVNADTIRLNGLDCEPNTVALAGMQIDDEQSADGFSFRPATFELHYRRSTWAEVVPSMGFRELITDEDGNTSFADIIENGKAVKKPVLLDKDGKAIKDPKPLDAVLIKFDIVEEIAFSALPLQ